MEVSKEIAATRLSGQLLTPPGSDTPEATVERILAVQAQDKRAFRLAIRARTQGLSGEDVDAALTEHRSLVLTWLCRGTLHLVGSDDYWWLHALTAPRMATGIARRLAQLGLDESTTDRGVDLVMGAVAEAPRTRSQLRSILDRGGVPTAGQALVFVLAAAALREHLVRGPVLDGEQCFVHARRWLNRPAEVDRDESLRMLARRYLAGHGPAAPKDLAAYSGVTLTDARRAFELIEPELVPVDDTLRALADASRCEHPPPPRLLGMFDPVLHGWADRTFVTGPHKHVVTANGLFRATALVDGRVAGTWTLDNGAVVLTPLERLSQRTLELLDEEARDVLRFLGRPDRPLRMT